MTTRPTARDFIARALLELGLLPSLLAARLVMEYHVIIGQKYRVRLNTWR